MFKNLFKRKEKDNNVDFQKEEEKFEENKDISAKQDGVNDKPISIDNNAIDNFYEVVKDTNNDDANNKESFFSKLKKGLLKTREGITEKIDSLLSSHVKIDDEFLEELEEILIMSDIGVETTMNIIDKLKSEIKLRKISATEDVKEVLKDVLEMFLTTTKDNKLDIEPSPAVILVVGVNGVGKTTSIGKLAYNLKKQGKKVLLAAGDTFRAAAIDQLVIWGERAGVNVIHHQEGSDPAAIIYDAIQAAKARKIDVLICDTAGRLHNKKNLMQELSKIFRVISNEFPEAKKEILLVLDATTGQNAISQAKTFKEISDITGIILTKLDGTAKGGVVISITSELDIPVKLIGVGEGIEDLQPFVPRDFVEALLNNNLIFIDNGNLVL